MQKLLNALWNSNALTKQKSTIIKFEKKQEITYCISSVILVVVESLALM